MAGPKQIWPGTAMRRFFAAILARETTLADAERARLAEALAKPIGRLLVYHDPADLPHSAPTTSAAAPIDVDTTKNAPATPLPPAAAGEAPVSAPPFDPFAFSVVAMLKRGGPTALLERLASIDKTEHLAQLAAAQHLAIAPTDDTIDALRRSIVAGAEARLAERRAAAS